MAAANVLGNGSKYKLWFPNYTVQSGRPVPSHNKAILGKTPAGSF
jgi:hypothetical protein